MTHTYTYICSHITHNKLLSRNYCTTKTRDKELQILRISRLSNMSGMMGSQVLVLATAMVVSSTVLFLAFSRQKSILSQNHDSGDPPKKSPRSCLSSGDRKREKKKKKVKFAENVKEPRGNGEEFRNEHKKRRGIMGKRENCRNEIPAGIEVQVQGMPANRAALYSGILKDRVHRIQCSY